MLMTFREPRFLIVVRVTIMFTSLLYSSPPCLNITMQALNWESTFHNPPSWHPVDIMPSYAFPVAPPSPYTEKAARRPYSHPRNQLQSTFSNQDPSHGYVVVPSLDDTKALGPQTKKGILYTRYVQRILRVAQLNGAVGLLVCTACTTNLEEQQSLSLRIAVSLNNFRYLGYEGHADVCYLALY